MRKGNQCSCVCDKHNACCEHHNYVLQDAHILPHGVGLGGRMVGNHFNSVPTRQQCCNMCRNHPSCTGWEFSKPGYGMAPHTCILKSGIVNFDRNPDTAARTTWAGTAEDAPCKLPIPLEVSSEMRVKAATEKAAKAAARAASDKAHNDRAARVGRHTAQRAHANAICRIVLNQAKEHQRLGKPGWQDRIAKLEHEHKDCFDDGATYKR